MQRKKNLSKRPSGISHKNKNIDNTCNLGIFSVMSEILACLIRSSIELLSWHSLESVFYSEFSC